MIICTEELSYRVLSEPARSRPGIKAVDKPPVPARRGLAAQGSGLPSADRVAGKNARTGPRAIDPFPIQFADRGRGSARAARGQRGTLGKAGTARLRSA